MTLFLNPRKSRFLRLISPISHFKTLSSYNSQDGLCFDISHTNVVKRMHKKVVFTGLFIFLVFIAKGETFLGQKGWATDGWNTDVYEPTYPDGYTALHFWASPIGSNKVSLLPIPFINKEEMKKGFLSSFSLPFSDLLKKKHESEWKNLLEGFSTSVSFSLPLKVQYPPTNGQPPSNGQNAQGEDKKNLNLNFSFKYTPLSYWFLSLNVNKYLNPQIKAPWNPDFTYSFGYDDWHPYTLSFSYSNYGGNRFRPDRSKGERVTNFMNGSFKLGYKFPCAEFIEKYFIVHESGGLDYSLNYSLTPEYFDMESVSTRYWKHKLALSTKYTIYKQIFISYTIYWYLDKSTKQPWDPDFTYNLGLSQWQPSKFSVKYNNYAGNQFPWNKIKKGNKFRDGSISISWNWMF